MIKLFNHQQELLTKNPKRCLVAWGTGTGKTLMTIALANENCESVLVVCPKALKQNWRRNMIENARGDMLWSVLTKEEFKKHWKDIIGYEGVIWDEAHALGNLKSQMSKSFLNYCKKHSVEYRWLATATPYLSTPMNIFALATHLGYTWNWLAFDRKFFTRVNMGGRLIPKIKVGIQNDIAGLVNQIGSTAKLEDLIDLPDQVFETEYFDLTPEQTKAIENLEEVNFISRWTKIHQICGGSLKGNEYEDDHTYPSDKLERLKELIIENDRLIIVCRYNNEIKMVAGALSSIIPTQIINGDIKNKDEIITKLKGVSRYCLVVNAACSEGWELPECPFMVFYSNDFSLKNKIQMIGRILRINNPKKNVYLDMIIKGTIDEDVHRCLEKKKDFHVALYKK